MHASRRTPVAALFLALSACSGHGSGSSAPPPPPPDAGGLWVGTWSNLSPDWVRFDGPMVMELHSVDAEVSGLATVPLVDGSILGPAGIYGAYDQPVAGVVGVNGIELAGGPVHLAGWIDPPDAASFPWDWPVWGLEQICLPFERDAAPADLTGTWAVTPVSSMGHSPVAETLTVAAVLGHVIDGSVEREGGALVDLLTGRTAGSTAWFAVHGDQWTEWNLPAFRVWAGTFDGSSGEGVYAEYLGQYYDLWDRGTWTATRR
jgi:hypothetical protein